MKKFLPTPTDANVRKAKIITELGWRRTSNKYLSIFRIDRPDWLEVLAESMRMRNSSTVSASSMRADMESKSYCWASQYMAKGFGQHIDMRNLAVFRLIPHLSHSFIDYVPQAHGVKINDVLPTESVDNLIDHVMQLQVCINSIPLPEKTNTMFRLRAAARDLSHLINKLGALDDNI